MVRPLMITLMLLAAVTAMRGDKWSAFAGGKRRATIPAAKRLPCTSVSGVPAVTFTLDEGTTTAPLAQPLQGIAYTYGLVALDIPNTLLAFHNEALLISTDAGCSWSTLKTFDGGTFLPSLIAAVGGRAYGWAENRDFLMRHTPASDTQLTSPVTAISGLGVDPHDGTHIRLGGDDGSLWESSDAGTTWTLLNSLEIGSGAPLIYKVVFDPASLDHIVVGTAVNGAFITRDGGRSWTKATGLSKGNANIFNLVISPVDPNVVWAMGIDLAASNPDGTGRAIYRSTDGGARYAAVIADGGGVKLVNGPTMAAHPRNPDVLYFVFGTYFQAYGTDLFRYNAATGMLTMTHSAWDDIDAIAFDPRDPSVMYLGLEIVRGVS